MSQQRGHDWQVPAIDAGVELHAKLHRIARQDVRGQPQRGAQHSKAFGDITLDPIGGCQHSIDVLDRTSDAIANNLRLQELEIADEGNEPVPVASAREVMRQLGELPPIQRPWLPGVRVVWLTLKVLREVSMPGDAVCTGEKPLRNQLAQHTMKERQGDGPVRVSLGQVPLQIDEQSCPDDVGKRVRGRREWRPRAEVLHDSAVRRQHSEYLVMRQPVPARRQISQRARHQHRAVNLRKRESPAEVGDRAADCVWQAAAAVGAVRKRIEGPPTSHFLEDQPQVEREAVL